MPISVKRKDARFYPDPKRVITRFFMPGNASRAHSIIQKVLNLSEDECNLIFNQILRQFSKRHRNITKIFEKNFNNVQHILNELDADPDTLPAKQKLVIGAYFTQEYSIESAAFFNPSIVDDPYQGNLQKGQKRIIVSFRATGEGHISSIAFRSCVIDENNDLTFEQPGDFVDIPEFITDHKYHKQTFLKKLAEMKIRKDVIGMVLDPLGDTFTYNQLQASISDTVKNQDLSYSRKKVVEAIQWLASSHYEVTFSHDAALSERVLFPASSMESNGIEDARFVRFTDEDGTVKYYATYTAYDGFAILPKLIETTDFYHFQVKPIHGQYAQNKGMALFPKKINGMYAMISRIDGVNNFIMFSENINLWNNAQKILEPFYPWEFVQVGNAGSPIETEHGWLVITHGVGPVRTYRLGAALLDLDDPTKVIARLKEPLLAANEKERDGYVPNVVYSCGSIIHNNELIIPYAISDYASTFASVSLDELFEELLRSDSEETLGPKHKGSILSIDDDAGTQESISKILMHEGYQVTFASDGVDALMLIAKEEFDLILSDIRMPNLDGFQLLKVLNEKKINIPVVFITAHHNHDDKQKSYELGAVEYIKKPIKRTLLLKTLKKLLDPDQSKA